MIVERPILCPRCQTPQLIEKRDVISSVSTVAYGCPRCGWKIEGKDPKPLLIREPELERIEMPVSPQELPEELDQPAYRFRLTDNGADPLNIRDGPKPRS